jgi:homoserine dehydrogenase
MTSVQVALLGFGNVGRAFAHYLQKTGNRSNLEIAVRAVADRTGAVLIDNPTELDQLLCHKETTASLSEFGAKSVFRDHIAFIENLASTGVSVLVESLPTNISTGQPALDLITTALEKGINVVTVDKGPMVHGFDKLRSAAEKGGSRFEFTGTIGVPVPAEVVGVRVLEIRGVLNGTTNFVLSEMQQSNTSFDEALTRAQQAGVAEPDPSLDVQGWDTAAKVLILAKRLMAADSTLREVTRIGIGPETSALIGAASERGRIVRLIGRARFWKGKVRVSVAPKIVGAESPFYAVSGTSKLAVFRTEAGGEVISTARSGRDAISQAIVEDIAKVIR